jgi:hypothetical protein
MSNERLVRGLHNEGYVVVIDNFFYGIKLFQSLKEKDFDATKTTWTKYIGLLAIIEKTKFFG